MDTDQSSNDFHRYRRYQEPDFCPWCGQPLMRKSIRDGEAERLVCRGCKRTCHLDPKVAACAAVVDQDRVLMVRRAIGPGKGRWAFPGGYVDRGELPERAAVRECLEETGIQARIGSMVGVFAQAGHPDIVVTYRASVVEGRPAPNEESLEVRWFPKNEIPWDALAFRSTGEALRLIFGNPDR